MASLSRNPDRSDACKLLGEVLVEGVADGSCPVRAASLCEDGSGQEGCLDGYASGLPAQILYLGVLVAPLLIAGILTLWRIPQLRFIAVATTVIAVYVLAWVPGKAYYTAGMAPAVLAALKRPRRLAAFSWLPLCRVEATAGGLQRRRHCHSHYDHGAGAANPPRHELGCPA
jgi:hypothetical protein